MIKTIEDAVRELGGVWPSGESTETHLYKFADGRYAYVAGLPGWLSGTAHCVCTRTEFEECTTRLRNEPSWDGAPDWAVAKAQDSTGWWYWYSENPSQTPEASGVWMYDDTSGRCSRAAQGEVIGNWRDTLRLRPEEEKVEDENDWYTKGEFPPVGTVCRLRFANTAYAVVTITYIGDGVMCYRDEQGMEYPASSSHVELRPLQTERERWIEQATAFFTSRGFCPNKHDLGAFYDAGLGKLPEDK